MLKSIEIVAVLLILAGCGSQYNSTVRVDRQKCWDELESGGSIVGELDIYYFKDLKTFAINKKCNPSSVGVSLDDGVKEYFDKRFASKDGGDTIAIRGIFSVSGRYEYDAKADRRIIIINHANLIGDISTVSSK